ncbi:MAG: FtsX-like permease family protein [Myxococcota bacterium]
MTTFVKIAVRNLLQARRRSLILGTALAAITGAFVMTLALSSGIHAAMVRTSTVLLSGHVNVGGFYKYKTNDAHAVVSEFQTIRNLIKDRMDGVRSIVDRQRGFATLTSESGSLQSILAGIDIKQEQALVETLALESGELERFNGSDGIILFSSQAKKLNVGIGDRLTLSAQLLDGTVNTADVTVVAIPRDVGTISGWNVFVAQQTVRDFYRLSSDTTGAILVYLDDVSEADSAAVELRRLLSRHGYELMRPRNQPYWEKFSIAAQAPWIGQRLDVTTWRDEVATLQWTLSAVDTVSNSLVVVLALIIAVGVTNAMWVSVRERSREIGTLRAIGMSRGRVMLMILLESVMLGLFSSVLGATAAAALASLIDELGFQLSNEAMRAVLLSDVIHLRVEIWPIALAIAALTTVTSLAGVWPAFAAARLEPVTAIQRTG